MGDWICYDQVVENEEVNNMTDEAAEAEFQRLFGDIADQIPSDPE